MTHDVTSTWKGLLPQEKEEGESPNYDQTQVCAQTAVTDEECTLENAADKEKLSKDATMRP